MSFTRKISQKNNVELTNVADTAFVPDGVYILHETLGIKTVEEWNSKNNDGVIGILLIEGEHRIVVALEDSLENLSWAKKCELVNQPIGELEDAKFDFNGEYYCQKLDSPDFPAAYYCLNYKKGGRNWYLPSSGELWMIYNHLEEIQTALDTVGGQKFDTSYMDSVTVYWSSTEGCATSAFYLNFCYGYLGNRYYKVISTLKVRPVSKFNLCYVIYKKNKSEEQC